MRLRLVTPGAVILFGLGYLVVAWALTIGIDVLDVGGTRSSLGRDEGAPTWYHLFREGSPTEMVQWAFLAAAALLASHAAGEMRERTAERAFLLLLGIASALMLIEDAGNPSHRVSDLAQDFLDNDSYLIEVVFRLPVFLLVAAVPLYAFIRYWPRAAKGRPGGRRLVGGLAVYGLAAASSVPANALFDFYPRAGVWVTETLFGGRMIRLEQTADWQLRFTEEEFTGTLFMDFVYEESVELVAASLWLAGVIALTTYLRSQGGPPGTAGRQELQSTRSGQE